MKFVSKLFSLFLAALMVLSMPLPVYAEDKLNTHDYGKKAYDHIVHLSQVIGKRAAGSQQEKDAAAYIINEFSSYGLEVTTQPFTYTRSKITYNSENIIAIRPAKNGAKTPLTLIVGAHYDSTGTGSQGAHDNASGIGVMLESAERLANTPLDYNLIFIAFGAEEVGLKGSNYYVSQMTADDISSTLAIINLDSLIGGDYLYIHGSAGEDGWLRDQMMARVEKLELSMRIQPGLNPHYPAGVGYPASDHVPFEKKGIPYVNFESTNWEADQLDDDMTGYVETVEQGVIWHTSRDTLEFLEAAFPGRVKERLDDSVHSLSDFFTSMDIPFDLKGKLKGK